MPISEIEFPAVTFCSLGADDNRIFSYFVKIYFEFLRTTYGWKIDVAPMVYNKLAKTIVSYLRAGSKRQD